MAKTYAAVMKEISALEKEAEALRNAERSGVIARIREAIDAYDLTTQDLFSARGRANGKASSKASSSPRYGDGVGNVWGGRGPRPLWLRDALAAGKQLSDFDLTAEGGEASSKSDDKKLNGARPAGANGAKAGRRATKKRRGIIKYRDGAGNAWTGFGPRPGWIKEALATGKSLEDLAV